MNGSMADYLRVVTPHLHPELVSPEALSRIQSLAEILPLVSDAILECRLGEGQSRVDFQITLSRNTPNLAENFLSSSAWQAVRDYCQEWSELDSFLYQNIDNITLEFDLDEQRSQVPIPCIGLALNQEVGTEKLSLMKIVEKLSLIRFKHLASSHLESNLQRCVNSLPDGARIAGLGLMLSRPTKVVKVVVKEMPPEQFSDYLVHIGWTQPTDCLSALASTFSEFVGSLALSFDIGDTIYPRIGLECFWEKQPFDEPRWQLFLDHLVERGLCTPAKQNALLTWSGFSQKADHPELWPPNLNWGDRFLGSQAVSVFSRTIYELKIVYEPGKPLEAKAYLVFSHNWCETDK
jgi:hypothetical protein